MSQGVYIVVTYPVRGINGLGRCRDDKRGPIRNRVCLPEHPHRAYWIYGIEPVNHHVAAPPGLRHMQEHMEQYGISKKSIVRSSLWADSINVEDVLKKVEFGVMPGEFDLPGVERAGALPGAFTIPICHNLHGEAISSVWEKKSKNYPCRCGSGAWEFSRSKPQERKESKKFYFDTGLYANKHFEEFCQKEHNCVGDKRYPLNYDVPKGQPSKAPDLKRFWRKCNTRGHSTHGKPYEDK